MHVVIIGAGEVGTSIAASLASDHEVVVIDVDPDRADQLKYELDVLTIAGDGTASEIQTAANVGRADMVIACTDNDQTNLVACGTAKTLGDGFTIARVKSTDFLRTWEGRGRLRCRLHGVYRSVDCREHRSGHRSAGRDRRRRRPLRQRARPDGRVRNRRRESGCGTDGLGSRSLRVAHLRGTVPRRRDDDPARGYRYRGRRSRGGDRESGERQAFATDVAPDTTPSRRRDRRRRWDRDRVSDRPTTRRTRLQAAADRAGRPTARGGSRRISRIRS